MLGSVVVSTESYWTEGRNTGGLKCNESLCYAEIDCCNEYVAIAQTQEELQEQYSRMDMFYIILKAIAFYGNNDELLKRAGIVIGNFISEGRFSKSFSSIEEENSYVVGLIQLLADRVAANEDASENQNFMPWYVENILSKNFYKTEKGKLNNPLSGLDDDDFNKKMKEVGPYMLYLVTGTTGEGGDERAILRKKMKQNEMLNYLSGCGNNVTKATILKNAEAGIVAKCGMKPEKALEKFKQEAKQKGTNGLGFVLEASVVAAIIVGACTLLAAVVKAYSEIKIASINAKADVQNKISEPTKDEINNNQPSLADWEKGAAEAEEKAKEMANQLKAMEAQEVWYKKPLVWLGIGGILLASLAVVVVKSKKKKKTKE